jgi:thymidylate synthase ThyX
MTSKELSKWSDGFMFKAEESNAAEGVKAYLLNAPNDPLGAIAACAKMYKGEVVRDLRDVTDAERQEYLTQVQRTILGMPLEAVQLHFMIEGVTRSLTHQAVRQRTAAYAQESMRFAVKEDMATAVAYPPSLEGTLSLGELVERDYEHRIEIGLQTAKPGDAHWDEWISNLHAGIRQNALDGKYGDAQKWRIRWDEGVGNISSAYLDLVNDGMPAEDARGLAVHNVTTRYNYISNLRNFYQEMAKRLSDQAQFEWRAVAMNLALAMREFGRTARYETWEVYDENEPYELHGDEQILDERQDGDGNVWHLVRKSSHWLYVALSNEMKPIDFVIGRRAFGADFDRPSRIGERVDAFAKHGVPSSEWTKGSVEYGIPPIDPAEWLLDPNSARLEEGQEFDVFGNRVPKGTGWHFVDEGILGKLIDGQPIGARWPRDFDADGRYSDDHKPGVDQAIVDEIIKGM